VKTEWKKFRATVTYEAKVVGDTAGTLKAERFYWAQDMGDKLNDSAYMRKVKFKVEEIKD
jgi:hypothetical protein